MIAPAQPPSCIFLMGVGKTKISYASGSKLDLSPTSEPYSGLPHTGTVRTETIGGDARTSRISGFGLGDKT